MPKEYRKLYRGYQPAPYDGPEPEPRPSPPNQLSAVSRTFRTRLLRVPVEVHNPYPPRLDDSTVNAPVSKERVSFIKVSEEE